MRMRWAVLAGVLLLGGCSSLTDWLEGRDKTPYRTSSTLPPLEVPPDLTAPSRDSRYVVPEAQKSATLSGYQQESKDKKPGATSTGVLPSVDGMRVERAGAQRWLVVEENPEKLWPIVKDFWQENGFLIKVDLPELGVMETEWAELKTRVPQTGIRGVLSRGLDYLYSTSERDKFRTRLERTADGKGTEIYVSHRGMEEVYTTTARDPANSTPGDTRWQPRPSDPGLEAEYLRRLMMRLGVQEDRARTLTANATPDSRAEVKKGVDGLEKLEVPEPFDRVWRRVGLALDRGGFTVEDRDRAKGVYFVRYADPELEKDPRGFFTRLFTNDSKVKAEQYRVQVTQSGTSSEVNVLNKDGAVDKSKSAQRILGLLHEQLK
jgi:outer membrane protein assembly factor BamC